MSNTINQADTSADIELPLKDAVTVNNFLPSPTEFVRKSEKEKVTIAIDKQSLELYKKFAKKHNTKYKSMMCSVLSAYPDKFLNQ